MAAARAKTHKIGSAQWIQDERAQVDTLTTEEVEEFGYSARNELDWLNEHMAEIFSRNALNFTDAFKTPGKLRGKTPRTARKLDTLPPRQPLTELFAASLQPSASPVKSTVVSHDVSQLSIPRDAENRSPQNRPVSRSKSPQRVGLPGNTDSGYHGITEDEAEALGLAQNSALSQHERFVEKSPLQGQQQQPLPTHSGEDDTGRSTNESFASARESLNAQKMAEEEVGEAGQNDGTTVVYDDVDMVNATNSEQPAADIVTGDATEIELEAEPMETDVLEVEPSHKDSPSPQQTLQRKSSFTFSSLPAREPLTGKRSLGLRNSHLNAQDRNSVLAKSVGKAAGMTLSDDIDTAVERLEETQQQTKTSAQLLHERISQLGKTKEPRPSRDVAQNVQYPQLPIENLAESAEKASAETKPEARVEDETEDWITSGTVPPTTQAPGIEKVTQTEVLAPARPAMHQKSISTPYIPSPTRQAIAPESRLQKAMSVSNPNLAAELHSTTPAGSPSSKRQHEGPLSASKSRLWSALKSARNIFASSASASAAAKLEAHDTSPTMQASKRDFSDESKTSAILQMPGALYSETQLPRSPSRPLSIISLSPSRKTRSSSESERKRGKEAKAQQKAAEELEKAREKERKKAAKESEARVKAEKQEAERREKEIRSKRPAAMDASVREEMPPPPPPKDASSLAGKLRSVGKPMRPGKDASKSKPAPVNVKVNSQLQRFGQASTASSSQVDNSAPLAARPSTLLRTASAQSNNRSSTMPSMNGRVKALEAAARKKELEEKERQRRADHKKEIERKRAAKVEEERKAEADRRAEEEQRRAQEAKIAAQRLAEKQAAEAKRREQQRIEQQRFDQQRLEQQRLEQQRLEQQRQQEMAQKAKAAHDLAEAIQRERTQQQSHPRGDIGGTLRQLAQKSVTEQSSRPPIQPNPAKPPKRVFTQDGDEAATQSQRPPPQRTPAPYQQNDAKRRKTDDERDVEERHSVMAPPKRPSTMRKETLTKFPHGYAHAPPPAAHHPASIFKATVSSQHQLQQGARPVPSHPSQTVQVSNARIPFAENANPPAVPHYVPSGHAGHENAPPGATHNGKFKTPVRSAQMTKAAKSSPMYPNGDSIALPDIATDSEDEEDDDEDEGAGFRAPSWVASPALRELLTQQQLVDPESVFGPIGELRMEEVFKGTKNPDRLKKFRDRGSSAAWVQNGDAVTSAEKRRDMQLRERVARDGGWRYEPGV